MRVSVPTPIFLPQPVDPEASEAGRPAPRVGNPVVHDWRLFVCRDDERPNQEESWVSAHDHELSLEFAADSVPGVAERLIIDGHEVAKAEWDRNASRMTIRWRGVTGALAAGELVLSSDHQRMIGWVERDGTRALAIGLRAAPSLSCQLKDGSSCARPGSADGIRARDMRALHRSRGESMPPASCRRRHDHRRQRNTERPDRARRGRAARRPCGAQD
jgi:hypothetical protein